MLIDPDAEGGPREVWKGAPKPKQEVGGVGSSRTAGGGRAPKSMNKVEIGKLVNSATNSIMKNNPELTYKEARKQARKEVGKDLELPPENESSQDTDTGPSKQEMQLTEWANGLKDQHNKNTISTALRPLDYYGSIKDAMDKKGKSGQKYTLEALQGAADSTTDESFRNAALKYIEATKNTQKTPVAQKKARYLKGEG